MRTLSPSIAGSCLVAAALFCAGPALAQNTGDANASSGQKSTHLQNELRQSLEKSGFKDIKIRPEEFVVHAQTPDGSPTVMIVSPTGVEGVVERSGSSVPPPSPRNGPGGSTSHGSGSSGGASQNR